MAYTPPRQWAHGDQPAAADMQVYSDGLTYLQTAIGGAHHFAAPYSQMPDTQTFYIVHSQRFLVYVSSGKLRDVTGTNEDISLGNSETINSLDLDTVDWLTYGDLYAVIGCSACMEDEVGT